MEVEDSDEAPKCVICGSEEPCQHLVANIDRSFLDCYGGEFCERENEFRDQVEQTLIAHVKSGAKPVWKVQEINQIWEWGSTHYDKENDYLEMDSDAFYRLVAELLVDEWAIEHPGQVIDDWGPRFTSAMTLLFAEDPKKVVQSALKSLQAALADVS